MASNNEQRIAHIASPVILVRAYPVKEKSEVPEATMVDMVERLPQPVHGGRGETRAPGELERVRRFMSFHDHSACEGSAFGPDRNALGRWLREEGVIPSDVDVSVEDFAWAMEIRDALFEKVRENMGAVPDGEAEARLNAAAGETGLRPRFGETLLAPTVEGVRGAVGRLLGLAFMAELDGSWHRFRLCADPTCVTVFYDRSKNHSAKWCSMQTCGNRNKVRAFRRRHAPTA